ncbi:MAG: hypothetical protein PHN99_06270 [Eubacteriales bacterium]|jgi:DNA-binding XRE family transcriptional regulator|nr:hypothetical protein [Eubacteriales bacterium]MDD4327412.1 hypothetical protein [Eubacteriales bacterium]MDD4717704.1 hypothetical protein [Eubacteriales bacterium]NCU26126.1 hypothetical protein [Candidatus Nomurabacteria bacterium]
MASKYELVYGYIKLAGYTSDEVAHELGITRRTLDNKVRGITDFTLTEAQIIKKIVGKPIDDIFISKEDAQMPRMRSGSRRSYLRDS